MLTFGPSDGQYAQEDAYLSDVDPSVSGSIVDDYYSYRYHQTYDGRYRDYQRYQDDPYYYDPYRRSVSHQYVPDDSEVAGLDELDDNGDWVDIPGHGHCWRPRVSSGWAPYRDGSWYDDQRLGLTWVSNESWGWAPYHYGRWTNANRGWFWEPGEIVTRPIYAPALVAFVPFPQEDRIGWVALGPGDPYVPRYYDRNYQPQYVGSPTYITQNTTSIVTYNNYNVAGAVTVVRTTEFTRGITPGTALIADAAMLARTRPVVDPYSVPRLREIAPGIQAGRAAMQVPVAAQQVMARSVVTSQNPTGQPVATNSGKVQNVQTVPEAQTKRQLRINNSGPAVTAIQANGLPATDRQQQKAERKAASQQSQQPATAQQQPATTQQQQKAERKAAVQQQGQQPAAAQQQPATTKQQQKAERKAAAQQGQQPAAAQQQQATTQQQRKAERKAAAQQQGQQQTAAQQQQAATKQQQKAARKAAAQQGQQPAAAQQQSATTQQEQKAERKAAARQQGQEQSAAQQQQATTQQQQKAERKAAARQQGQEPAATQQQPATTQQQQKAERKAAAQQQPVPATPSKAERRAEKAKNKNSNSSQ